MKLVALAALLVPHAAVADDTGILIATIGDDGSGRELAIQRVTDTGISALYEAKLGGRVQLRWTDARTLWTLTHRGDASATPRTQLPSKLSHAFRPQLPVGKHPPDGYSGKIAKDRFECTGGRRPTSWPEERVAHLVQATKPKWYTTTPPLIRVAANVLRVAPADRTRGA